MKQILSALSRYEYWANEKLLPLVLDLSETQQQTEIGSSFPSVYKTCLHMWDASSIWWQRVQKHEQIVVPSLSFHPSMKDIVNGIMYQDQKWINWVDDASEGMLSENLAYKNLKGDPFVQPVSEILLHLPNHGTYHRGQLVTMLRQLGVEKIPQTDYILFSRS